MALVNDNTIRLMMMKYVVFALVFICHYGYASLPEQWWDAPYPAQFDAKQLKSQSRITVSGNTFVDENSDVFAFRGVSIADPDKLKQQGKWSKALFEEVANWGANSIRIPIHPGVFAMRGADFYISAIDDAVLWANELGLYLIIDWHSIGNLQADLYQHPMYDTSREQTLNFWKQIAFRYQHVPTVAVYELFNEPTNDYIGNGANSLGYMTWSKWQSMMTELIDLIRQYDNDTVLLVAGFNWAYDLTPVRHMPIQRENIAYAVHPYPQKAKPTVKSKENFFMLWDKDWGFVAQKAPMIATEIGWSNENAPGAHVPTINNDGSYGPQIIEYLEEHGISWTAWVFDPQWAPQMIKDWDYTPTEQGHFFKKEMLKHKK